MPSKGSKAKEVFDIRKVSKASKTCKARLIELAY